MKGRYHLRGGRIVDPEQGVDAIADLYIEGDRVVQAPVDAATFEVVDCRGQIVAPAFVDLHAAWPDLALGAAAAVGGGFATVALAPGAPSPIERPAEVRDLVARAGTLPVDVRVSAALTIGLAGDQIGDVALLAHAGAAILSNGVQPIRSVRLLRNLLEYTGRLGVPLFLRAADIDLEAGGVVREGPRAAWLGLPSVPPEAEEIGISTVAALVRRTGARVHLTHVWSARGVVALRRARHEGLPITASTTSHHLAVSDDLLERLDYAGTCRFQPPLGDTEDRAALIEALRDGTLDAVATDHRPVPLHLQDRELEIAVPGALSHETALPLVLSALPDLSAAIRALATGPARILGQVATLRPGAHADVVVFDPQRAWTVGYDTLHGPPFNTPLFGASLQGAVTATFARGRPVLRRL